VARILVLALGAPSLLAQYARTTGNLYGRISDEQAGVLQDVSVTISGPSFSQTHSSDSRGEFRALNVAPGTYTVMLARAGFESLVLKNVTINLGRDTELTVTMKVSAAAEAVTVSGATPELETRRVMTGANVSQEELKSIPTPRDPWALLQSIPGVQLDRVNVGGSEGTLQATFSAKGSALGTFAVDGVSFTDVYAAGSSSADYDFDAFQEIQVVTGGSDPAIQGSGVHLNMITRRGTNELHGSGRVYVTDGRWSSENLPEEARGQQLDAGNRIDGIQDYGAEVGGPVVKDRMWIWGAYGRYQTQLRPFGQATFRGTLENFNAKLSGQPFHSNSAEVWYQRSDILRFGRNGGATHPQETTWDQKTPQNSWKIEDSQVFSSNLFASAQYSGQNGNFVVDPVGGLETQAFLDADGVWHNSYEFYVSPRSQRQASGESSFFFDTGKLGHELKAGFSYIHAVNSSLSIWPGDGANGLAAKTYGDLSDCDVPCAVITRDGAFSVEGNLFAAFLSDTLKLDRLTASIGLRWDQQYGRNKPTSVGENPSFPELLPALDYSGGRREFTWTDWQPRLGLTYSLGPEHKTIAKASYARFAEALGLGTVFLTNPTATAYAYYVWTDRNGDHLVQRDEVDTSPDGLIFSRGYDPGDPANPVSVNGIDPDLRAPAVDEIIIGVDHELTPGLGVGVSYTYRRFKGQLYSAPYDARSGTVLYRTDYEQYATLTGTLPNGLAFSEPVYQIRQSVLDRLGGVPPGFFTFNRRDFSTTYDGLEVTLTKRLAGRWMARGSFTWNRDRQHVGAEGCADPTNVVGSRSFTNGQSCRDGDLVAVQSAGFKTGVFLNSSWQASLVALYQLPFGLAVAASFYTRQGYPINWYVNSTGPTDSLLRGVAVAPAGSQRYEDVRELDLRAEKSMSVGRGPNITISADLFNVTNENTVLQRQNRLGLPSTNSIREVQSPRIWRLGFRYSF
jgi:Carboxypeptidase regulatory-like domain/TonB-dependent Receptor Plug Domain